MSSQYNYGDRGILINTIEDIYKRTAGRKASATEMQNWKAWAYDPANNPQGMHHEKAALLNIQNNVEKSIVNAMKSPGWVSTLPDTATEDTATEDTVTKDTITEEKEAETDWQKIISDTLAENNAMWEERFKKNEALFRQFMQQGEQNWGSSNQVTYSGTTPIGQSGATNFKIGDSRGGKGGAPGSTVFRKPLAGKSALNTGKQTSVLNIG